MEGTNVRDPVGIVQDAHLLKICGLASSAFVNLAEAAGLRTRRLLLLDASGGTKHVVVEVKWDGRWVVVDPSSRSVFRDQSGRALTKDDLRNPEIIRGAIWQDSKLQPTSTDIHVRPHGSPSFDANSCLGLFLRHPLNFLFRKRKEVVNWGYFIENPSLWPMLISLPLLLLAMLIRLIFR